jgi:DHA2 family multidrug resistance protein-like MFS transporter
MSTNEMHATRDAVGDPEVPATTLNAPMKAGTRDWIGLGVLALPCILYSMDLTVLNLAVPQLTAALQPSSVQFLWIVDIYGFLLAGSLITMGTLGDRIGRRKLLMIGASAFGAASLLAAFSVSAPMLIAARAVLGVAAATLAPSTLSLLRNMFLDPRQRTFAIGVWIASFSAGGAIGPLLGGLLLEHFWWGSVFLLNVPVMALLLVLAPILLREFRDPNAGSIDLTSAALSLAAVLVVIYGVKKLAEGVPGALPTFAIVLGVATGIAFVRRQRTLEDPLIDLSLFRSFAFSAALAVNVIGFFVAFGTFLFIAQYLQLVLNMSPLEAGLWSAPSGVAFIVGSLVAPALAARMQPARVIAGGFVLAAVGFVVLTQLGAAYGPGVVVAAYVILSLGLAPVFTMAADLIVGAAPPERAGAASGLAETSAELGGALGIAVLGSLVTALYRRGMASTMPDQPANADAARDTIGAAAALAADLPGESGVALLQVAREAFTDAVVLTAVISAALAVIAAITIGALLRNVGGRGGAD